MKLSNFAINRPVTMIMAVLLVILFGVISLANLPVDLYPNMNLPYAVVITSYDGAGPEEIESLVTKPLESVLSTVPDIKNVMSSSSNGRSQVLLEFVDGTDMDFAMLDVREKVDLVKNYLPDGVGDPLMMKADPSMMPIMELGVISKTKDLEELKNFIEDNISDTIERIDGVASVGLTGGMESEISIKLSPEKIKGYGITTDNISQTLAAENLNLPAGTLKQGSYDVVLRTIGEFKDIEDIKNLPILTKTGVIYLRDVATIEKKYKEMKTYSYINDRPSINLSISKESLANTVELAKRINAEITKLDEKYDDIEIIKVFDSSEYINSSINNVMSMGISGGLIAILVLYVFLRHIGTTLVVALSIPVSIIGTFVLMYFNGLTLNMISLGGLALGVGMLVDNSIVVLENIYRHKQEGKSIIAAATVGSNEVAMAIAASTFTSIAVFLPLVFTKGIVIQMFKELALTISFSLLSSLVVALTVVPMLALKFIENENNIYDEKKRFKIINKLLDWWEIFFEKIENIYEKALKYSLRHKKKIVLFVAIGMLIGCVAFVYVKKEAFPASDEGKFSINIELPEGTIIEETFEIVEIVKEKIKNINEIKDVFLTVGSGGGMFGGSAGNKATITLDIGKASQRDITIDQAMDNVREALKNIPGCKIGINATESGGGMGGSTEPINIELYGEDLIELSKIGEELVKRIEKVEGTREVKHSLEAGGIEATIEFNRNKTSAYGLNTALIARNIETNIKGKKATTYKENGTEIDVMIEMNNANVNYIKDINNIYIESPFGINVPLNEIAEVEINNSPTNINRLNKTRYITINSKISGTDLGTVQMQIDEILKNYKLPDGYYYKWAGDVESMMETFINLGFALIIAVILVYMVMAAQFESFVNPFIIMISVPISLIGAAFGLFIMNVTLSIPAFVGFIILAGIVVNNAIVLIDYINQLRQQGYELTDAITTAGKVRLKPIAMTTLTTVFGMLPMALGLGEGGEVTQGLAIVVIFGLSISTLLTLIVVPVIYMFINGRKKKLA